MKLIETPIKDLFIVQPHIFSDARGDFFESYSQRAFQKLGLDIDFVQDNESFSDYGVIRGLHYQTQPHSQLKLVRAVSGTILDVAVDLRRNSPTFGKYFAYELNGQTKEMLLIPQGFAHGFSVLSPTATVVYKCDALYEGSAEGGLRYDDPTLGIDWRVESHSIKVSEKDNALPFFKEFDHHF